MRYVVLFSLFCLPIFGAPDRITRPVTGTRVRVPNSLRPQARASFDRGDADASMPVDHATLFLKLSPGVEPFLADQQNPASKNFHRWLTPEQFADNFGLSGNDLSKIADWLRSQGLTVHDLARGRHWITFSGTAGQIGNAFGTQIRRYRVEGEDHFANASEISVPEAFAGVVSGVGGLDDFVLQPLHHGKHRLSLPAYNSASGKHYLAPADYATIYNIAPLHKNGVDGTGQKIAVIGRTDVNMEDIRSFRTRFGLPPNDPQVVLYGSSPGTRADDLIEADLDLEWAGATAPGATIVYVNSVSVDLSAQYAVDQNLAPVMTFSYGACEQSAGETLRAIAQQANAQGITWMVASGDGGAATCDYGTAQTPQATKGATVAYPSSIPEITSVGGTQFDEGSGNYWNTSNDANLGSARSYIPERVWNDAALENAVVGGGGGASLFFAKPSWQTGPGVPNDNARDIPDISLTASGAHDGYQVVSGGSLYSVGGTSASSPAFAGIIALLNQSSVKGGQQAGQGNINPALYRLAKTNPEAFHDVTVGDNLIPCAQASPGCVNGQLGYAAASGYDLASGLGSVDAFNLVTKWNAGAASTVFVQADITNPAIADSINFTATVMGAAGAPTGSITFVSNDLTLGTVSLLAGAKTSTATTTVAAALIAGGNGTVSALYSGDTNYAPSSGTVPIALNIPAGDAFVVPAITPNPVYGVSGLWFYSIKLLEKAGVGATLTAFTIDGVDQDLTFWTDTKIAPNGSISASLERGGLKAPLNRAFHFGGTTANGGTWSQDISVPFLPGLAPPLTPNITLSVTPTVIQQNPQADASCQWLQHITVQETGGFQVSLASFGAGTASYTSRISALFGTNRLAPFGTLSANICFSGITAPSTKTYTLVGIADDGSIVGANATATFSGPASSPAPFSVDVPAVSMSTADASGTAFSGVDLNFTGGSPAWTASVAPAGDAAKWLTVQPVSGNGSTTIKLQAAAAGLSKGVYSAVLNIQASDAMPQTIALPVLLTVGASGDISISGANNAASGGASFAPGMLMAVYGRDLAPSIAVAGIQPLPLTLAGTSATVNGVAAPLWFVSPGQMNVQIPYETSAGPAILGINNNGKVALFTIGVKPTAPGIFASDGFMVPFNSGKRGQTIVGFVTGDGDVTPTLPSGATPPAATRLSLLPQPRQPLTMTIGGSPAKIAFAGITTGLIGVTQVNFTIPADAPLGVQSVVVTAGGTSSAPVNLTVLPAD